MPYQTEDQGGDFEQIVDESPTPAVKIKKPKIRTKASHPRLTNRLPRESGGLIVELGDPLTPFERALEKLGRRVQTTKRCYLLDGRPCNTAQIIEAAAKLIP